MTPQTGTEATQGHETADVVARAREALENVTRGPWKLGNRGYPDVVHTPNGCLWHPTRGDINNQRDGEFVAASRSLIPELIAEVERLHSWDGPRIVSLIRRITEVLREHRFERWSVADAERNEWWGHCTGCGFEGQRRQGYQPEWELNMRDDEAAHVAERVAEALQLTEETGWLRNVNGELEHAVVGWVAVEEKP